MLHLQERAAYLEEWLRFYELVGVEHFILYDNASTDHFLDVLRPWMNAGRITLMHTPPGPVQLESYRHCLQNFRSSTFWLAFLDIDEFLFSPTEPDLRAFLRQYEPEAGVVADWAMFGANGHVHQPKGLVTLNYTRRAAQDACTFDAFLLKAPDLDPSQPDKQRFVHSLL